MPNSVLIAPSLLASDFANLEKEIKAVESAGADWLHLDVMDGQFVPNISFGQPVVKAIAKHSSLALDVHLMVHEPGPYLADFASLGAAMLTIHVEAVTHLHRAISHIKDLDVQAGVALNPSTPLWVLEEVIDDIDMVCLMSVNPGFGGQKFIAQSIDKCARLREICEKRNLATRIEIDGGVTVENAQDLIAAGADVLVAGTSIFGTADYQQAIKNLRSI